MQIISCKECPLSQWGERSIEPNSDPSIPDKETRYLYCGAIDTNDTLISSLNEKPRFCPLPITLEW